MTNYIVKCLTLNQTKLIESDTQPTECPIDSCDNFTVKEDE